MRKKRGSFVHCISAERVYLWDQALLEAALAVRAMRRLFARGQSLHGQDAGEAKNHAGRVPLFGVLLVAAAAIVRRAHAAVRPRRSLSVLEDS